MNAFTQATCLGLLVLGVACQSEPEVEQLSPVIEPTAEAFTQEEAYPGIRGPFETLFVNGSEVSAMRVEDEYVMEGDILLPPSEPSPDSRTEAAGVISQRWPNGVVYYAIDPGMPQVNLTNIQAALNYWRQETNVRFVKRTNQPNYVAFQPSTGCSAHVGMIGGRQVINLSTECDYGNTVHEIGHCVGLFHEHTRPNRDKLIRINFENILEGYEDNFVRADVRTSDVQNWAGQMDFNSIMMYFPTAFSKNGKPTIVRKDGKGYAAQRKRLSSVDIAGINRMYQ